MTVDGEKREEAVRSEYGHRVMVKYTGTGYSVFSDIESRRNVPVM